MSDCRINQWVDSTNGQTLVPKEELDAAIQRVHEVEGALRIAQRAAIANQDELVELRTQHDVDLELIASLRAQLEEAA